MFQVKTSSRWAEKDKTRMSPVRILLCNDDGGCGVFSYFCSMGLPRCIILSFALLVLFDECKQNTANLLSFNDALTLSKQSTTPVIITIVDGTGYDGIRYDRGGKFICDFSLTVNYDARRIICPDTYPLEITLYQGKIESINDQEVDTAQINDIFLLQRMTRSENIDTLNLCYEKLSKYDWKGSTYIDYLYLISCYKTGRIDEYNIRSKEFIQNREMERDPLLFLLKRQLPSSDSDSNPPIMVLDTNVVDMGEISIGIKTTKVIQVYNKGQSDLVIFHPVVSCSCLTIKPPRVIKPGERKPCVIEMISKGPIGKFRQESLLVSNAENRAERLLVIGIVK